MRDDNPRIVNVRGKGPSDRFLYVGREMPGRFRASPFGNPFSAKAGKETIRVATAAEAVEQFRRWVRGELDLPRLEARRNRLLDSLPMLQAALDEGLPLGCWCAPGPCHAEVLLELVDEL